MGSLRGRKSTALLIAVAMLLPIGWAASGKGERSASPMAAPPAESAQAEKGGAETAGAEAPHSGFSDLRLGKTVTAGGMSLRLPDEDSARIESTMASDDTDRPAVHVVSRFRSEDGGKDPAVRYDAVAVDPERGNAAVYPMYEIKSPFEGARYAPVFGFVDETRFAYVVPRADTDGVVFDIDWMDAADGRTETLVPGFWRIGDSSGDGDDFFIGSFVSEDRQRAVLNSFKGRLWLVDFAKRTAVPIEGGPYPAYGDPGSTPPRSLVYPSGDLHRFLYEESGSNRFVMRDCEGARLGELRLPASDTVESPGIQWGPGGRYAAVEYAHQAEGYMRASDNGLDVFAQGMAFIGRDGHTAGKWESSGSSPYRMDLFGWADERTVLASLYRPRTVEGAEPEKTEISYRLYDIASGKETELKEAAELGQLRGFRIVPAVRPSAQSWAQGDGAPFLFLDPEQRLIWLPPAGSELVSEAAGAVTVQMKNTDGGIALRFGKDSRTWKWLATDAGEMRDGYPVYAVPVVLRDRWLAYVRSDRTRADYIAVAADGSGGPEPVLPASFSPVRAYDPGQAKMEPAAPASVRAVGESRFGKITLVPREKELEGKRESGRQFTGDYDAVFRDLRGRTSVVGTVDDLLLFTEGDEVRMSRLEFEGFDVLLLKPVDYPFVRSWDGNVREVRAFLVTETQEARQAAFSFRRGDEPVQSAVMAVDDNVRPYAKDGSLVLTSPWNGGTELAFRPDPDGSRLVLEKVASAAVERAKLFDLAQAWTERLEQALRLEEAAPKLTDAEWKRLRSRIDDRAWNNKGFQTIYRYDMDLRRRGTASRAFAWNPIDFERLAPDTVRFTFTLNLFYAVGQAAHLDVVLKWRDGDWYVYDMGTLAIQPLGDGAPFAGQVISDRLETGLPKKN
ncbi:hypothetical protein [Cohnella caldifontis]|uniref:hypothetical protein n=1 Tax=Cohnella caldifontis TaxID=3027471 RepID=UPI0023EB6D6E|nr:hypothetical protein [Cohnella sp. YIM B05605]